MGVKAKIARQMRLSCTTSIGTDRVGAPRPPRLAAALPVSKKLWIARICVATYCGSYVAGFSTDRKRVSIAFLITGSCSNDLPFFCATGTSVWTAIKACSAARKPSANNGCAVTIDVAYHVHKRMVEPFLRYHLG